MQFFSLLSHLGVQVHASCKVWLKLAKLILSIYFRHVTYTPF